MQVMVVGGAGVLGQALVRAIVTRGVLTRSDGSPAPVRRVIAVDRTQLPRLFVHPCVEYVRADLSTPRLLATVMGTVTDSVFHAWDGGDLAGAGQTRAFALIDSMRDLFAACARHAGRTKVVLASSYAADPAAGALPASQDGLTALIGELLLTEAGRRGEVDGRALRLALVADAPGCASFIGELLRALRDGRPAHCPIARDTPLWLTSAPAAALALVHAHELPALAWAGVGCLNAPGRILNVEALLEALGRLTRAPIDPPSIEPDAALCEALAQRPRRAAIDTSLALGFEDAPDADALVRQLVA
jgi:nucleoside-diphosphate-sugar epimerase